MDGFEREDFISNMPDDVVTNIMDRLPLQDAVRTGILARNWRFKWTLLSQLVFDEHFYKYLSEKDCRDDLGKIISMFLCHLEGAVTKFVLYIHDDSWYSEHAADINHWFLLLSSKGIKYLTLTKMKGTPLELPTHLFSCLELKDLFLLNCCVDPPPSFHGFPNLLSLDLRLVQFESRKFWDYVTQCQVLYIWTLSLFGGTVKLVDIAKLSNLKILYLCLGNTGDTMIISSSSILELVGCLPKLQELYLCFFGYELTEDVTEKRFPTTFPCLKTLRLSNIDLGNGIELSYAFQMIRSSPNLQTLRITSSELDDDPRRAIGFPDVDYNTMGMLHLRSVVFEDLKGIENEVWLIKYVLACSPFLEKIVISLGSYLQSDEKSKFAKKLLKLHRASPVVDINFS